MRPITVPDFSIELSLLDNGHQRIAGVDEVGRGPWAGPVVAAAVILNPDNIPEGLQDSKKLSAQKRDFLFESLQKTAQFGIGVIDVNDIDRLNILQASLTAMSIAINNLPYHPSFALIDGNKAPVLNIPNRTIVKGDGKSLSIAAASIIAKVSRDRIMKNLGADFPGYGWERNMGYGTKEHQAGLAKLGITPHHRKSFAPIKKLISDNDLNS